MNETFFYGLSRINVSKKYTLLKVLSDEVIVVVQAARLCVLNEDEFLLRFRYN